MNGAIQTSALTWAGVRLAVESLIRPDSTQLQTSLRPPVQFTRRSTPLGTYQSKSAPLGFSMPAIGYTSNETAIGKKPGSVGGPCAHRSYAP